MNSDFESLNFSSPRAFIESVMSEFKPEKQVSREIQEWRPKKNKYGGCIYRVTVEDTVLLLLEPFSPLKEAKETAYIALPTAAGKLRHGFFNMDVLADFGMRYKPETIKNSLEHVRRNLAHHRSTLLEECEPMQPPSIVDFSFMPVPRDLETILEVVSNDKRVEAAALIDEIRHGDETMIEKHQGLMKTAHDAVAMVFDEFQTTPAQSKNMQMFINTVTDLTWQRECEAKNAKKRKLMEYLHM